MGSLISLRIAFKYPDHVLGVVAISSTPRAATPEVLAAFQQFYDAWVSTPVPEEALMELGILGWGGQLDVTSDRCREVKRNWTERYNGREKVEGIAETLNTRDDIVSRLSEISCPVLLIHGEKDASWGIEEAEITKCHLKDVELKVIPGEGHMLIFIRDASDVNRWIEKFVNKLGYES